MKDGKCWSAPRLPVRRGLSAQNSPQCFGAPDTTGQLFILVFFFYLSFFLWSKLGLFLFFSFAFISFSLITHICFSLLEKDFTIKSRTFRAGETIELDATLKKVGDEWPIDNF